MAERQFINAMGGDDQYQEFRSLLSESRSARVVDLNHLLNGSSYDRGKYYRMRRCINAMGPARQMQIDANRWVVVDVNPLFNLEG